MSEVSTKQFHIKTERFEGPLELLLTLIEARKLTINDFALAKVADDFVQYLQSHPEYPLAEMSQFVYVASTLLLLKSKSLLPVLTLTEEEQGSIADLEHRLRLYQKYRDLAEQLRERFGGIVLETSPGRKREPIFAPQAWTNLKALTSAVQEVLKNLPQPKKMHEVMVQKAVSLEETIERLRTRIEEGFRTSFHQFSGMKNGNGQIEKREIVVSFLALLELVKQGVLAAEQSNRFSDIMLESNKLSAPRYE